MAEAWLQDGIPVELQTPVLCKYGIYRKLNDDICREKGLPIGCEEFISYCATEVKRYISFQDAKLQELLNKLPK